ncbi:hypothetical protein [Pseudomonas sp. D3-10]|uniref:hypothetical protein n=1 Tax=Pseudomonas sp. D3-10 TaxID=2817392 RepID=UPI003DA82A79
MTDIQAKALKIWALILWTALWCWVYSVTHGQPIQYVPGVEINALQFCVTAWFLPWLPRGLRLLIQAKRQCASK